MSVSMSKFFKTENYSLRWLLSVKDSSKFLETKIFAFQDNLSEGWVRSYIFITFRLITDRPIPVPLKRLCREKRYTALWIRAKGHCVKLLRILAYSKASHIIPRSFHLIERLPATEIIITRDFMSMELRSGLLKKWVVHIPP